MSNRGWDSARLAAFAFVCATGFFLFLHLFFPKFLPEFLRLGVPKKTTAILIVGADINYSAEDHSQLQTPSRADSIMLIQMQPAHNRTAMLSIPRDSFVEIPNYGTRKINASYSLGGLPLLRQTIESITGIHIDKHFIVQPNAVRTIVDKIGGVRVFVDRQMDYEDHWGHLKIHLKPGWQWLNGEELQGFLRFRRDAMGDIRRIERQQGFLSELASGHYRPGSIFFIPRGIRALAEVTQTNLQPREMVTAANFTRMMPAGHFIQKILPGTTDSTEDGQSIWRIDPVEKRSLLRQYFVSRNGS